MITFILNDRLISTAAKTGMTLLDLIRNERRLKGTKIGCREGDCGACSVLVGSLKSGNSVDYQSITSCISPLGNARGKHIVTIEGVNLQNEMNAAQEAMNRNYATQCGFCTPGFAVSLTGFGFSEKEKNHENAIAALSGNICRCTGYNSIKLAAHEIADKLKGAGAENRLDWLVNNKFIPSYFLGIPERLKAIDLNDDIFLASMPISGGTDMYVKNAETLEEEDVFLVGNSKELSGIKMKGDQCIIEANTTVTEFWNNQEIQNMFPNLDKHLLLVSSEPIRNMASFGGNLVNASPIGDMTIFFLSLDSNVVLEKDGGKRKIRLRDFYKAYKNFDLREGELLTEISFNRLSSFNRFNFEKICKRKHLDIASVNTACTIELNEFNEILFAHVAMGGVAPIPKYLLNTSNYLKGEILSASLIIAAAEILQQEIDPITDVRGTEEYKRLLARQLFMSHFIALFPLQLNLQDLLEHVNS